MLMLNRFILYCSQMQRLDGAEMIRMSEVETKLLDNNKYVQLTKPFFFFSDILNQELIIPAGFISDFESIPIVQGTSKRAGLCHDYCYRINSVPTMSRGVADTIYFEIMTYRGNPTWRKYLKFWAVKLFGKRSYHKLMVEATIDEILAAR